MPIRHLLDNNRNDCRRWIESVLKTDPDYFKRCKDVQKPQYFWIGCSDSRCVAEAALGLGVGDMFVHRNVGNCISHCDQNAMSALEYSVKALKVRHVLVCGHENCGAVKAALTMPSSNSTLTNCWISQIRDVRNANVDDLAGLDLPSQVSRLVQLNVCKQVFNVCTSPVIQQAWENGEEVFVHGLVFNVATGELRQVMGPYSGNENVPENSTELDADSLAADSAKLKKSRSLAGVMNKLGEALQTLEDSGDEPLHGKHASEARTRGENTPSARCDTRGTSPTLAPTQPSSYAETPRGNASQEGGSRRCSIDKPGPDTETTNAMLFDSASDPTSPPHTANNSLSGLSKTTANLDSVQNLVDLGRHSGSGVGGSAESAGTSSSAGAGVAKGVQQRTKSRITAGDINDLPHRLSQQMSFHRTFENDAKQL